MSRRWVWSGVALIGLCLVVFPDIDLAVSRLFFILGEHQSRSFAFRGLYLVDVVHEGLVTASYVLSAMLVLGCLAVALVRRPAFGLDARAWLFLALAMAIGPGLLVNAVFKDNWDRARPSQIVEFGGTRRFSPALVVSDQCHHNCSFVSGEASFGFFFHSFGYVARRRQRALFVGGLAAGLLFGLLRVGQGAHFLSDVYFAGVVVVAATAAMHALVYGRARTAAWWREHVWGDAGAAVSG